MSVIPQPQTPTSRLQPFHETVQELASGCVQYEQALSDLFCDVDRIRAELEVHLQSVVQEQCELRTKQADLLELDHDVDDMQRLRSEIESRDLQLAKALDELQAVREELAHERQRASEPSSESEAHSDHARQLEQDLAAARSELAAEGEALAASRTELHAVQARLTETQGQLTETQGQLAETKGQLAETQGQLAEARVPLEDSQHAIALESSDPFDSTTRANMTQEREALEAELELVRSQAAELHETVRQQQHEMVTQKSELGGELKQLRRLVEKQADLIADRAVPTGRESVTQTVAAAPDNMSLPSDPVVNSVMAQFAKLQKDVAQRRRRKP